MSLQLPSGVYSYKLVINKHACPNIKAIHRTPLIEMTISNNKQIIEPERT